MLSKETMWVYSVPPDTERHPQTAAPHLIDPQELWTDVDFVADASAIDGIKTITNEQSNQTGPLHPKCSCQKAARLKTVFKENKNHGRKFFACANPQAQACSFFMWAPETGQYAPRHSKEHASVQWKRLDAKLLAAPSDEYSAKHVKQGRVGDCWFVSALSVIAEKPKLIHRILPNQKGLQNGYFIVRFFIDGKWREYAVDNYFPLMPADQLKKSSISLNSSAAGPHLYFAKAVDNNLWVPVLEKAYAKAHSSYKSISGGFIAEALFDLTGFPTESICFGSVGFDSEVFWTRLLSFQSQGFLMGAACPTSRNGLVGGHAYSLLQVVEETIEDGLVLGKTKTLKDYFADASQKRKFDETEEFGVTEYGTLRLIKLRNPWGSVEWKGRFGIDSAEWSASLRKRLNVSATNDGDSQGGGVFWMSYHDFLARFMQVDVCFTHQNHQVLNIECMLPESQSVSSSVIELSVPDPSWINISLCQRTKRGKSMENFYYTDLTLLILAVSDDNTKAVFIQDLRLFGQGRDSHFDLFLGERDKVARYILVPLSIERETDIQEQKVFKRGMNRVGSGKSGYKQLDLKRLEFTIRIMSANPVGGCFQKCIGRDMDFVWDAVERAICDMSLVGRPLLNGSPTLTMQRNLPTSYQLANYNSDTTLRLDHSEPWSPPDFTLRVTESRGVALAHFTNTHPKLWIRIRFQMRAATKTYNSTVATVWRYIPPRSRRVVGACVCPSWEGVFGHEVMAVTDVEWDSFLGSECWCSVLGHDSGVGGECACRSRGLFGSREIK
ncbi:UNVERIFIED_CONTAM: Calpain-type cysteine protease dek1 [Siphonaria sp. JEL0065]|nr:Calpain-type cysteine protease dek1 [Siphonaria sp. JEL0065]